MKSLIIFFVLVFGSLTFGQKLSARDSIGTIADDDIFAAQLDSSGTYTWRKIFYSDLFSEINTTAWTAIKTFNGADFSAGAHGGVTFADSVDITGLFILPAITLPTSNEVGTLGSNSRHLFYVIAKYMYADGFHLLDPGGSDSSDAAIFTYDGTNVTVDKNFNITDGITLDSASTFNVLNFEPHSYTVPGTGDTILILTLANSYSLIELDLPGSVTPGISKMQVDEATKGMIIKFYNNEASYTIIFEDIISGDDNLYLSADMTLAQYDYIEMLCIDATKDAQVWIETSRSNN